MCLDEPHTDSAKFCHTQYSAVALAGSSQEDKLGYILPHEADPANPR